MKMFPGYTVQVQNSKNIVLWSSNIIPEWLSYKLVRLVSGSVLWLIISWKFNAELFSL